MINLQVAHFYLLLEALAILAVVTSAVLFTAFRRQRRRKKVLLKLVSNLKTDGLRRRDEIRTTLKELGCTDDEAVNEVSNRIFNNETAFYQFLIPALLVPSSERLLGLDKQIETLTNSTCNAASFSTPPSSAASNGHQETTLNHIATELAQLRAAYESLSKEREERSSQLDPTPPSPHTTERNEDPIAINPSDETLTPIVAEEPTNQVLEELDIDLALDETTSGEANSYVQEEEIIDISSDELDTAGVDDGIDQGSDSESEASFAPETLAEAPLVDDTSEIAEIAEIPIDALEPDKSAELSTDEPLTLDANGTSSDINLNDQQPDANPSAATDHDEVLVALPNDAPPMANQLDPQTGNDDNNVSPNPDDGLIEYTVGSSLEIDGPAIDSTLQDDAHARNELDLASQGASESPTATEDIDALLNEVAEENMGANDADNSVSGELRNEANPFVDELEDTEPLIPDEIIEQEIPLFEESPETEKKSVSDPSTSANDLTEDLEALLQ